MRQRRRSPQKGHSGTAAPPARPLALWLAAALLLCAATPLSGLLDLDELQQDFIVRTHKIEVPGYPDAFNPCVVRWGGGILMSFRARDPHSGSTNPVGFVWLDEAFNVIGAPSLLQIAHRPPAMALMQDPRLVVRDDRLYIVYSNMIDNGAEKVRRLFIARVYYDGVCFAAGEPQPLLLFEGTGKRIEKNWMPFLYGDDMLLVYSMLPHKVFKPLIEEGRCQTIANVNADIRWRWGEPRGGTPAHLVDGRYLAFFHSCATLKTVQSQGKPMWHYVFGAYTFQSRPPFAPLSVSAEPIVHKTFYNGPTHKTWKPLRVVFPMGYIYDDDYIWLTYGRQDFESWVVQLDRRKLLDSLVPLTAP